MRASCDRLESSHEFVLPVHEATPQRLEAREQERAEGADGLPLPVVVGDEREHEQGAAQRPDLVVGGAAEFLDRGFNENRLDQTFGGVGLVGSGHA